MGFMMRLRLLQYVVITVGFARVLFVSCESRPRFSPEDIQRAEEAVKRQVVYVCQFHDLFPMSKTEINYLASDAGHTTSTSKTLLYKRFEFTMVVPIVVTPKSFTVAVRGEPTFYLREIESVELLYDGRKSISYAQSRYPAITVNEWQQLVAADGNWRFIGISFTRRGEELPALTLDDL
jgi:hypothetical protein